MKKFYETLSRVLLVFLMMVVPMMPFAQTQTTETKKVEAKTETTKTSKCEKAPSHNYWSVTGYGSYNQFNGDLSKNIFFNETWEFGAGLMVTKQFTRVMGLRFRGGWAPLAATSNENVFMPEANEANAANDYRITQNFQSWVIETDLEATINWVNWIMGYKPERFFSSYLIAGLGADHTQGAKYDGTNQDNLIGYIGYPTHMGYENLGYGNNSGVGGWNVEFKVAAGLGFDFNLSKHWSINPEVIWRLRGSDFLDMTKGGNKQVINDMYSGVNLGLTYKFAYRGCDLKVMEKNYGLVKYETTPSVLTEKGDSVVVTVKGTIPPKYFCPQAVMYWQPQIKYNGGVLDLKPIQLIGEKVVGNGTMIRYQDGGTFTYTTIFPYKPEMANSEMVITPIIYDAKGTVLPNKDEIKAKAKYIELGSRTLATGIIHTSKRVQSNYLTINGLDKYQKEVIASKSGILYFRINKYNLEPKFGINKTQPAQDVLNQLNDFLKKGWTIKNITIDGYASPDGEETFNVGLSENRSKTGNTYMIDQFKAFVKENQKENKDKKAVKAMVDAAGKDVNFVIQHHGPDWNGFLKNVQTSNVKDKDKILNVINSSGDEKAKEAEIRKMIQIYPEIEENLLPPLRRAEITANLYEPRLTDEQLVQAAKTNPESVGVEAMLYAGTLVQNADDQLIIYENAARVYSNDWRTLNNAAVANIKKGNLDKASGYLQKAAAIAPNNGTIENNLGVIAGNQNDVKKAETSFKKAQQLGENENNNLGIIAIKKGDYSKANTMLGNEKCTYNLGLAQLLGGNNTAAQTTLACAPQNPDTYYLLAVCGARTNNTKVLYENLMKAVADPKLKEEAKMDKEFINYSNTPDFKNIVK
jgi:outer membrane protein OmpA-like peptidoglycan-associated protein/tetratricopeptide (TPR) repeat protein